MRAGRNLAWATFWIPIFALTLWARPPSPLEGPPDAILQPPPFVIHSGAQSFTQRFEIPSAQPKDRWIRAIRFQSCDPRLVQSAYFYVGKTHQWLGSWSAGENLLSFPDTVAAYLPASSMVIVDVRYQSIDQDSPDCSSIGLYFTDKKPLRPLTGMGIQTSVQIPGGTAVELKKEFTVINDSYALALQPEMRAAGRSMTIRAIEPSGAAQLLYEVSDFNGNNHTPHVFEQPIFIPKGTRIVATASFRNPDQETAADDMFKVTMSLYPRSELRPVAYDAPSGSLTTKRSTAGTRSTLAAKSAPTRKTVTPTKKTISKKSPAKKNPR